MSVRGRFFPKPSRDARAEALVWRERLEMFGEDEDVCAAFNAWLEEDEQHGEAYARLERVWRAAAEPALQPGADNRSRAGRRRLISAMLRGRITPLKS